MTQIDEAFKQGIKDGLEQPWDLTSGVTYPDSSDANTAYDAGANVGQGLGQAACLGLPSEKVLEMVKAALLAKP